jgi:hypothetical protein
MSKTRLTHKGSLSEISSVARDRYGCDGFSGRLKRIVAIVIPHLQKDAGTGILEKSFSWLIAVLTDT